MTVTKTIDRKTAETARARAIALVGRGASADAALCGNAEARACVATWNAFCEQEEDLARMTAAYRGDR